MQTITFYKYQGAGNDFILIDNRTRLFDPEAYRTIQELCNRRFGIGADGLMLLQPHASYAFEMKYYNADGFEGTMCGNGGRCIVQFAYDLGMIKEETEFIGIDGPHKAIIASNNQVRLAMQQVDSYRTIGSDFFLDTGSPHYVTFVEEHSDIQVLQEGKALRKQYNCNVNFVKIEATNKLHVRTFERGVEDETLACGTGVVASSLAYSIQSGLVTPIEVKAQGGHLSVCFEKKANRFLNIWLDGPAHYVFQGTIPLPPDNK